MRPTKALRESFEPVNPGAFMPDGSFKEDALYAERGPMDALVRSLVRQRRAGTVTPSSAASLVKSARSEKAFPSISQWELCSHWALAWEATAAEGTVIRCGNGPCGHWCGQVWLPTNESDCGDPRHRPSPCPPEVMAIVEGLFSSFSSNSLAGKHAGMEIFLTAAQVESAKRQASTVLAAEEVVRRAGGGAG